MRTAAILLSLAAGTSAFVPRASFSPRLARVRRIKNPPLGSCEFTLLTFAHQAGQLEANPKGDLTGKVAFIAGVADSTGYGWAIAKALADAVGSPCFQPGLQ